jgi:hypothetical protein
MVIICNGKTSETLLVEMVISGGSTCVLCKEKPWPLGPDNVDLVAVNIQLARFVIAHASYEHWEFPKAGETLF